MTDHPGDLAPPRTPTFGPEALRNMFVRLAGEQAGDEYRFGAEARDDAADPTAFDSSELVEWAAHRSGVRNMPDGSWNQYRFLHERGGSTSVEEALSIKGALVFGFSSDPLASPDRPGRAYVAISMGDGKNVIDISERGGEVRVMPHGGFYNYGAKIPEFHAPDELMPPPGVGVDTDGDGMPDSSIGPDTQPQGGFDGPDDDPVVPGPSYGPNGRILHEPLSTRPVEQPGLASEPDPPLPDVSYPDPPLPDVSYPDPPEPDVPVDHPDFDGGPTSQADPTFPDSYTDSFADLSADV